jgi:hypothetical protein
MNKKLLVIDWLFVLVIGFLLGTTVLISLILGWAGEAGWIIAMLVTILTLRVIGKLPTKEGSKKEHTFVRLDRCQIGLIGGFLAYRTSRYAAIAAIAKETRNPPVEALYLILFVGSVALLLLYMYEKGRIAQ